MRRLKRVGLLCDVPQLAPGAFMITVIGRTGWTGRRAAA